MALKAGTIDRFDDNSMAAAMENAFNIEWNKLRQKGLVPADLPPEMEHYWRVLFVSTAQGVIYHLKEQARNAFKITSSAHRDIGEVVVNVEYEGDLYEF